MRWVWLALVLAVGGCATHDDVQRLEEQNRRLSSQLQALEQLLRDESLPGPDPAVVGGSVATPGKWVGQ